MYNILTVQEALSFSDLSFGLCFFNGYSSAMISSADNHLPYFLTCYIIHRMFNLNAHTLLHINYIANISIDDIIVVST